MALLLFPVLGMAQEEDIKVESFELSTTTNYANLGDSVRFDLNGEKCALIIIDTRHPELLTFDCGGAGVVDTDYKDGQGQVWVYVPGGVKRLSIFGKGMSPLRDYDLGLSVVKARTYIMRVTTKEDNDTPTLLRVKVVSELDNKPITEGSITINGVKETLDQNGGYEKELLGRVFRYRVESKYYKTTDDRFVADGEVNEFVVKMKPNYVIATIRAPKGCEILVDGESVGKDSWTGRLILGERKVTCRLDKHYDLDKMVTVVEGGSMNILLDKPKEIQGTLSVMSSPSGAYVIVDGVRVGTTPYDSPMLIGRHVVEIQKSGYTTHKEEVDIKQDWPTNVRTTLKQTHPVYINSLPSLAEVYVDGKYAGRTPIRVELRSGKHDFELKSKGYYTLKTTEKIGDNQKNLTLKLKRQRFKPYEFYLGGGCSLMSATGWQGHVGTYLNNINIELGYWEDLGISEPVYWYSSDSDSRPVAATYKGTIYKARLGYGLALNNTFRITPQVGLSHVVLKESADGVHVYANGAYSSNFTGGVKLDIAVTRRAALTIVSDYTMPVKSSVGYELLEGFLYHAQNLSKGLGVHASINLRF